MNKQKINALHLAVLAALTGVSFSANAAFTTTAGAAQTAAQLASELPVNGITVTGLPAANAATTSFAPSASQNLQVTVLLGGGAKFSAIPRLVCNINTTGATTRTAAAAVTGVLNLGGAGSNQAVFTIGTAGGKTLKSCLVSAVSLTVTGAHTAVTETITFKYGNLASSTVNGNLVEFQSGVTATVTTGPSITAKVTGGFVAYGNTARATAGVVKWAGDGSTKLEDNTTDASLTSVMGATSGSITVSGNALLATKTTAGVWLVSAGKTCANGTVLFSATGHKQSVTFTGVTAAHMVTGFKVCVKFDGTTAIQAGTISAKVSGVPKTNYTLPSPAAMRLMTVSRNGSSKSVMNMPRSTDTDAGFLRVYNTSTLAGAVTATVYNQAGTALATNCSLSTSVAGNSALVMSAAQIETACGFTTPTTGRYRIDVNGAMPSMEAQAFARSAGVLTNISAIVAK